MIAMARWRKCLRESDASFFILVQVQAGPPAFAGFASFGSASQFSPPRPQGRTSSQTLKTKPIEAKTGLPRRSSKSEGGMRPFWGLRGYGIWSKDRPAREGNPRSGLGDA